MQEGKKPAQGLLTGRSRSNKVYDQNKLTTKQQQEYLIFPLPSGFWTPAQPASADQPPHFRRTLLIVI